jgi:hypothetical protein
VWWGQQDSETILPVKAAARTRFVIMLFGMVPSPLEDGAKKQGA